MSESTHAVMEKTRTERPILLLIIFESTPLNETARWASGKRLSEHTFRPLIHCGVGFSAYRNRIDVYLSRSLVEGLSEHEQKLIHSVTNQHASVGELEVVDAVFGQQ